MAPPACFDWRAWDDEAVVFVHASGDTHALGPAASALLLAMLRDGGPARQAPAWLALITDAAPGEPATADTAPITDAEALAFEQVLLGLERIGLVVRQAP